MNDAPRTEQLIVELAAYPKQGGIAMLTNGMATELAALLRAGAQAVEQLALADSTQALTGKRVLELERRLGMAVALLRELATGTRLKGDWATDYVKRRDALLTEHDKEGV